MEISTLEWTVTIGVTVAVLLFDVIVIARDPHEPSFKECAIALSVYIGAAVRVRCLDLGRRTGTTWGSSSTPAG